MPTDRSESIQVQGLREFQAALKALDDRLPRELAQANYEAADHVVAREASRRARSLGGVAGKAAASIKAAKQQRAAAVSIGGPQFPFALGAEFGGQRRPTTQQFKPWKGHEGYFLWPAIRETKPQFMEVYERAIDDLMRRAFPS